jgi:hypothetical protein
MALHVIYCFKAEKNDLSNGVLHIQIVSIFGLEIDFYRLIRLKISIAKGYSSGANLCMVSVISNTSDNARYEH